MSLPKIIPCPVCEDGIAHLASHKNWLSKGAVGGFVDCYGYTCDYCGSDFGTPECTDENARVSRQFYKNADETNKNLARYP